MRLAHEDRHVTGRSLATRHSPLATRAGFTLVELLVVIAIIAILFSLTSAAVIKVISVADETANRTEIGSLETAVEACKHHWQVKYLPSRIRLRENMGSYNMADPLDKESVSFLKSMWPTLSVAPPATASRVDWNGDGAVVDTASWELQGDQCLVFWLGGIPARNGVGTTGFSTNKRDPSFHTRNPGLGSEVVQPFFEFKSNRLVKIPGSGRSTDHYSYLDTYGRGNGSGGLVRGAPYAYFTSYRSGNDYVVIDCAALSVAPYHEPAASAPFRFHNGTGFQIISAGLDGRFGPGGPWSPANATGIAQPGRDDQANFYDRKLGVGQ